MRGGHGGLMAFGGPNDELSAKEAQEERVRQEALQHLLLANGFKEDDLQRHPEKVTHIEMVLDDYCCMQTLQRFPKLKSVCLIQQAIAKLEGLENARELERLLLNENRISVLEGLGNCANLKQLYLCSNTIAAIGSGLQGLRNLQILWIAENLLPSLDGLEHCPALTELNAARNRITALANAFDGNPMLKSINLADNQITSYREILELGKHCQLTELNFSDPDWGENPICLLCNYQAFTLYHLPGLQVHDKMRVGPEEHLVAQSAFSKKRLYYNMRMKLNKRQGTDGLRAARSLNEERTTMLQQEHEAVTKVLKRFESAKMARSLNPAGAQPSPEDAGEGVDLSHVQRQARESRMELADAADRLQALTANIQAEIETLNQGLILELHTGGNLRFEPGVIGRDSWATSVEELVRTRFRCEELEQFGIVDMKVASVTRIHNRSLRIRFEELMEIAEYDSTQSKQLEYLFYVPDPANALTDVRHVAEHGFASSVPPPHHDPNSEEPPMLLTNSIGVAEALRLELQASTSVGDAVSRALERAARQEPGHLSTMPDRPPAVCGGTLLICSTCILDEQPDIPACFDGSYGDVREQWLREPSGTKLDAAAYGVPETQIVLESAPCEPAEGSWRSVFRSNADDPSQKVWHTSQPEAVLPEFLVEIDYMFGSELLQPHAAPRLPEHGPFGSMFRDHSIFAKLGVSSKAPVDESAPALSSTVLSQIPKLPELPRLELLDSTHFFSPELQIISTPEAKVLRHTQVLNLHGRGLRRIDPSALELLATVKVLLLSFNAIENIGWLQNWQTVTHLDVSFNMIQSVTNLQGMPSLKLLDLSWNSVLSMDAIGVMSEDTPELESLNLSGNPVTREQRYRSTAVRKLKNLKTLDERDVSSAEAKQARGFDADPTQLDDAIILNAAFVTAGGQQSMPGVATNERYRVTNQLASRGQQANSGCGSPISRVNWYGRVDTVDLRGFGLTDLCDMSSLTAVRRLFLCRNQFTSLEHLEACAATLEELSIEDNLLTTLRGLDALVNLRRLDAASNRLTGAMELQRLTRLSQLSLEDNYVDSMDTFAPLSGLMELYLSNNLIEELRSVLMLKQLPKLMVLDFSGNDLCRAADYRPYTIFHMKRLKVLDGMPVSQADQHEADDKFSGKATLELLEDKLGPSPACYNFRSVDLAGLGLKDLGTLINDNMFPSLRELNLDGNPFSDLRQVGPLSKLLVLRMNKTKIDLGGGTLGSEELCGGFNTMPHLQVLELGSSGITDITHIAKLPLQQLRILHLQGNDIARVDGLQQLEQLRELILDRNKIRQFDEHSFTGLKSLRELRVEDNQIKTLDNLGPLPRLRTLYLSQNRIGELTELEKLRTLRHVVMIHLAQNPVAKKPLYRSHIIAAVGSVRAIDGREVTDEEREKVEQLLSNADPTRAGGAGVYVFSEALQPINVLNPLSGPVGVQAAQAEAKRGTIVGAGIGAGATAPGHADPRGVGVGPGGPRVSVDTRGMGLGIGGGGGVQRGGR